MAQPHERECAVCTNDFTIPKILPCGHLLCRECVISWMITKRIAGCPLCRCPIVEQSDQSAPNTADALPTDFVMEALVDSARVLSKHQVCCVCDDVKADSICIQCFDTMCSSCAKIHKKMSMSRNHDVESLSTMTAERLAASRPALCADHGDKQAEFFCREHGLAVCLTCKSKTHKVCPEPNYLEDEIQSAQNSLNDLTKILVEAEQKLQQAIGQLTSRLQEVDVSEQEDMAQVDKTCDRLQKLVEDFCNKLKEKTRTSHLKIRNSLNDLKTAFSNRLGKVTSHKHIVTRATAVSPRPALIHMRQTLTDRVNSLDLSADLHQDVWVKPLSSSEFCEEVVGRVEKELMMMEQQKSETKLDLKAPDPVFQEDLETIIRLTKCDSTAKMTEMKMLSDGMLFSRDALVVNVLYEVKVDAVLAKDSRLSLGLTRIPPARIIVTKLSEDRKDSIIIESSWIFYKESCFRCSVGERLSELQSGNRVGVLVDSSNNLHLYIDGKDQGIAAVDVTQPCFAVFDISYKVIQVTALPTSRRK